MEINWWDGKKTVRIRPIKNFENYYAGEDGNIYSTSRGYIDILSPLKIGKSYFVELRNNDLKKAISISTLILQSFIGETPYKVRHVYYKDNDHKNSSIHNIEWSEFPFRKTIISKKIDQKLRSNIGVLKLQSKYGICKEWEKDTCKFVEWSKGKWYEGAYLIRIDKSKPYSPDNCYWGDKIGMNKLNCEMVHDILEKSKDYMSSAIAKQYSISGERVRQIKRGSRLKNCE